MSSLRNLLLAGIVAGSAGLGGCAPTIDTRGNQPSEDQLAAIQPGADKAQIIRVLGSPTSVSTFDDKVWYYASRRTEQLAFLAPDITDAQVVILRFNDAGKLQTLDRRGMDQIRDIEPADAETPTGGSRLGLFEQLFGNIGRFSGGEGQRRTGPRGTPGGGGY